MTNVLFVVEHDPNPVPYHPNGGWKVVRVEGSKRFPLTSYFRKEAAARKHAMEITRNYWLSLNRTRNPYLGD